MRHMPIEGFSLLSLNPFSEGILAVQRGKAPWIVGDTRGFFMSRLRGTARFMCAGYLKR